MVFFLSLFKSMVFQLESRTECDVMLLLKTLHLNSNIACLCLDLPCSCSNCALALTYFVDWTDFMHSSFSSSPRTRAETCMCTWKVCHGFDTLFPLCMDFFVQQFCQNSPIQCQVHLWVSSLYYSQKSKANTSTMKAWQFHSLSTSRANLSTKWVYFRDTTTKSEREINKSWSQTERPHLWMKIKNQYTHVLYCSIMKSETRTDSHIGRCWRMNGWMIGKMDGWTMERLTGRGW